MSRAPTHSDLADNSGSFAVPPVGYGPMQQQPPPARANHDAVTLQGVLVNPVVKLLAGLALAASMAYVSVTVSRIDDRLDVGEATDQRHNERLTEIDKWQVEHRFEVAGQGKTSQDLLAEYHKSLTTNHEILERIADAVELFADTVAPDYVRRSRSRSRSTHRTDE